MLPNPEFLWRTRRCRYSIVYSIAILVSTFFIVALFIEVKSIPVWLQKTAENISKHSLEMYLISSIVTEGMVWRYFNSHFSYTYPVILLWCPLIILVELIITLIASNLVGIIRDYAYKKLILSRLGG